MCYHRPITSKKYQHFWQFQNCTDLTIEGSGTMYGQVLGRGALTHHDDAFHPV